jgi:hypothetical protein
MEDNMKIDHREMGWKVYIRFIYLKTGTRDCLVIISVTSYTRIKKGIEVCTE